MVREATAADARAVAELQVSAWRAAYSGFLPRQLLNDLSVSMREAAWREVLAAQEPPGFTLVAEAGDGSPPAGFCSLALPSRDGDATERTAEIAATYVDPRRWGSGVGRSLLSHALGRLRDDSWEDVTLWVFLRNAQGRAFYARSGFRLDGKQGTHAASGVATTRMRLSLDAS